MKNCLSERFSGGASYDSVRVQPNIPPCNLLMTTVTGDADAAGLALTLEFSGGAELLVGKQKRHMVTLPYRSDGWTIATLLPWLAEQLVTPGKQQLLIQDGSVRPGVLVLINDCDWELLGQLQYSLQPNDLITFISTLHGG